MYIKLLSAKLTANTRISFIQKTEAQCCEMLCTAQVLSFVT